MQTHTHTLVGRLFQKLLLFLSVHGVVCIAEMRSFMKPPGSHFLKEEGDRKTWMRGAAAFSDSENFSCV